MYSKVVTSGELIGVLRLGRFGGIGSVDALQNRNRE